jgi:hypothetical protein
LRASARRQYRGFYLFVAALTVFGCGFLLADAGQATSVDDYSAAVECSDTSSAHCYQRYPGVINSVRVTQTTSGQRDEVHITSRNANIQVSLLPSAPDAGLVQAGAAVTLEWYVGSVTTVWIGSHGIQSTSSPFNHADFAYVGWILLWLAAFFGVVMLISRRLARVFAMPWVAALTDRVFGPAGSLVALPGGTIGWSIRSKVREVIVLPLLFAGVGLISIRPFMNPDHRLVGSIFDLLLFGAALVSLTLMIRNSRVMADTNSLMVSDRLGRVRTWPLIQVGLAARFNVRGPYSEIACVTFIGREGDPLFTVSSLFWDIVEAEALCARVGIPLDFDYYLTRPRRINRRLRLAVLAVTVLSGAGLAWSFFPAST